MNKYVLGTVCAASVFASCTNEELIKSGDFEQSIDARQIEVLLGANYSNSEDADSRMALIGNDWAWVNGDMIGACYVGTLDKSSAELGSTISTNYPFDLVKELTDPSKTADFKTNTTVYEGAYVFYHQYDGDMISTSNEAGTEKNKFYVNFPNVQSVNPKDINENVVESNLFVSPVINMGGIKWQEENKVPVQFVSMYSVLKLDITNSADYKEDLVINKVEVIGDNLTPNGYLDFTKFSNVPSDKSLDAATIKNAVAEMNGKYDFVTVTNADDDQKIYAVVEGGELKVPYGSKEAVEVKVVIPSGVYNIGEDAGSTNRTSIEDIIVYTNKGKFIVDAGSCTSSNAPVTGQNVPRREMRSLSVDLKNKAVAVEKFEVANMDDWYSACRYAESHTDEKLDLIIKAKDIKVTEVPNCPIYVTGQQIELAGENITFKRGSDIANIKNTGSINLTEEVVIGNIENYGDINIASTEDILSTKVKKVENFGVININGTLTPSTDWKNLKDNSKGTGVININKDAKFIITIGTWENNSTINIEGTMILDGNKIGTLKNEGVVNVKTESGKFEGIDGYCINNNGRINLDAIKDVFLNERNEQISTSFVNGGGKGYVVVAVKPSDLTNPQGQKIAEINGVSMTGDWAKKSIEDLNSEWTSVIYQEWNSTNIDLTGFTGTEFNDIKVIDVNGDSKLFNNSIDVASINATAKSTTAKTINVNGNLYISKYVTLGEGKNLTQVNYPILNVYGSVVNDGFVKAIITVGKDNNTKAVYTNNVNAKTYSANYKGETNSQLAELNVYGTFINKASENLVRCTKLNLMKQGVSTFTGKYTAVTGTESID